jgi:hypothetical protein
MKPGDLVICINDKFDEVTAIRIPHKPKLNKVYEVRQIVEYPNQNRVGINLVEIVNPQIPLSGRMIEPTFDIKRFQVIENIPAMEEIMMQVNEIIYN